MAVLTAASVWAVGSTIVGNAVSMHWDGSRWTQVLTPYGDHPVSPAGDFAAVAAVSASDIWAVGGIGDSPVGHWDGRAWTLVPSPASGMLTGVAAASPSSAWAVGSWSTGPTAIIEHWDGTAWTWPPGFCAAPSGPGCSPAGTSSSSPLPANTYVVPSAGG